MSVSYLHIQTCLFLFGLFLHSVFAAPTPSRECIEALNRIHTQDPNRVILGIHYFLTQEEPHLTPNETRVLIDFVVRRLRRNGLKENEARLLIGKLFLIFQKRYPEPERCGIGCQLLFNTLRGAERAQHLEDTIKALTAGDEARLRVLAAQAHERFVARSTPSSTPASFTTLPNPRPPPTNAVLTQRVAEMAHWEISAVPSFDGFFLNGGERILAQGSAFSGRAEIFAAQHLSWQGERFLGVTDYGVAYALHQNVDPARMPSSPDLLSLQGTAYRLREVKSGYLIRSMLDHGIDQLQAGLTQLLTRNPNAQIDRIEIVYVPNTKRPMPVGYQLGEKVAENRYQLMRAGQPVILRVNGREFPVTFLELSTPVADPDLRELEK